MWCRLTLVLAIALVGCGERTPPSFLLYVVDTLRADALGCYGGPPTPQIDGLARRSRLFEQAYASASWTRPSMASLFTGQDAVRHGVEQRSERLGVELPTLPRRLAAAGYRTAFITANPNAGGAFGFGNGFDELIELYQRRETGRVAGQELVASSAETVDRAIAWLEQAPEPFFLAVLDVGPHQPLTPPGVAPETWRELEAIRARLASGADDEELDERLRELTKRLYRGEVQALDAAFGRLLAYLEHREGLQDTLLVFTADHGEEFLEHGGVGHGQSLYEEVLRVPLLVHLPRGEKDADQDAVGQRVPAPVSLVDVPGAVPGWLGLEPRSASALRAGEPVLASLCVDGAHQVAYRHHDHKLVIDLARRRTALFDLARDPGELAPIADPETERTLRRALRARLGPGGLRPKPCNELAPELADDVRQALDALGYGS